MPTMTLAARTAAGEVTTQQFDVAQMAAVGRALHDAEDAIVRTLTAAGISFVTACEIATSGQHAAYTEAMARLAR